ncbi:ABC transporter type 1, transmembrane domain-containing protein, partial [Catenaria anguillulae PL171]
MLKGKTIISVTHQPNYFTSYDGVIEMEAGKIKSFVRQKVRRDLPEDLKSAAKVAASDSTLIRDGNDDIVQDEPTEGTESESDASTKEGKFASSPTDVDGVTIQDVRALLSESKGKAGKGISEERVVSGSIGMEVYGEYLRHCGLPGVILQLVLLLAFQACNLGQQYWIGFWSTSGADAINQIGYYFGIYGALVALYALLVIVTNVNANAVLGIRAARNMSREMFARILAYPMSFFDQTPVGRVINRLSSDQDSVDSTIPNLLNNFSGNLFSVAFAFIAVAISSPWFLLLVVPIVMVLYYVASYYVTASRQVMRLISVTRSPVYALFGEMATGRGTILAKGSVPIFAQWLERRLDTTSRVMYTNMSMNRWLSAWLQLIGSLIVFSCVVLAVVTPRNSVLAGVGIMLAQSITGVLMMSVRIYIWLENAIIAVERIR